MKPVSLGDICRVIGGGTPSKGRADFYQGSIPWASIRDMQGDWLERTEFRITPEAVADSATNIIPAGNVLIASRVGLGKVTRIRQDTAINQDIRAVIPNDDRMLERQYLFYWFKSISGEIEAAGKGATVKGVTLPFIKGLQIPLPALAEQRRIVGLLDDAFAGIATAKANAEKSLRSARYLLETRIAEIFIDGSQGWERKTLREVSLDFGRGKSKHRPRNDPKLYGGPYPFIQTGDVRGSDHLITDYSQSYSEFGLAQSKLWPKGALCITIAANIAETGILDFDACFPDSIIGVVADPKQTSNKFLEYLLQSVKTQLKAKGKGSAQDNINLGTFENERFPFPSLAMQCRTCNELDELAQGVRDLESLYTRKLAALDELKQSLLQQAFSGNL